MANPFNEPRNDGEALNTRNAGAVLINILSRGPGRTPA